MCKSTVEEGVGEWPTLGAIFIMTNYNHKDIHYEYDCDDCAFFKYDKEAMKVECLWCDTCKVHHDLSGRTHADWSSICSCGCRCPTNRTDI